MEGFHFYDFIIVTVFILLVVLSLNEISTRTTRKRSGQSHGYRTYAIHFYWCPVSMCGGAHFEIHGGIVRKSLSRTRSGILYSSSSATVKAIQYWKVILRTIFKLNTHPWSWIVIVGSLIFIWHILQIFDYASTHEYIHVMQHLSFIMIGSCYVYDN